MQFLEFLLNGKKGRQLLLRYDRKKSSIRKKDDIISLYVDRFTAAVFKITAQKNQDILLKTGGRRACSQARFSVKAGN